MRADVIIDCPPYSWRFGLLTVCVCLGGCESVPDSLDEEEFCSYLPYEDPLDRPPRYYEPVIGYNDPGRGNWERVPEEEVIEKCKLDPETLRKLNVSPCTSATKSMRQWLLVRYGKICWATPEALTDTPESNLSATKTLAATTFGIFSYQQMQAGVPALSYRDPVSQWLQEPYPTGNARFADVFGMVAHENSLDISESFEYQNGQDDAYALRSLPNIMRAIAPDGGVKDLRGAIRQYVFEELGMMASSWSGEDVTGLSNAWHSSLKDMARLGLLLLHDGFWNGKQVLDREWVYRMTHPAVMDGNNAYGYFTRLNVKHCWCEFDCEDEGRGKNQMSLMPCAPTALIDELESDCDEDCGPYWDVGAWEANGANGQLIIGHKGLDLVLVTRNWIADDCPELEKGASLWDGIVSAIVAQDPVYQGDRAGFCEAYGNNRYAPDILPATDGQQSMDGASPEHF